MIINIDIHVNCVHMLLNKCVISLKKIIFWDGGSTGFAYLISLIIGRKTLLVNIDEQFS
jgi:hypothetical protein